MSEQRTQMRVHPDPCACGAMMVVQRDWNLLDAEGRADLRAAGFVKHGADDQCATCYTRTRRERTRVEPTPIEPPPAPDICPECERALVPQRLWNDLPAEVRDSLRAAGIVKKASGGLCAACYVGSWRRNRRSSALTVVGGTSHHLRDARHHQTPKAG